ncbi:MAG TPA: hypothetical protein PK926_16720 [Spirochaetota bacterium]|nr:hypothetical protein [Spirochaetota bacterium]
MNKRNAGTIGLYARQSVALFNQQWIYDKITPTSMARQRDKEGIVWPKQNQHRKNRNQWKKPCGILQTSCEGKLNRQNTSM